MAAGGPGAHDDPASAPAVSELQASLDDLEHSWLAHVSSGNVAERGIDDVPDRSRGPVDARLTLVEFGDYTCPHTREFATVLDEVLASLGEPVRFGWRHFPLVGAHPGSALAALVAEAAAGQGEFWLLHDRLVHAEPGHRGHWVRAAAEKAGLDIGALLADVSAGTGAARVLDDVRVGMASGVNGTPTLFVNGRRYDGEPDAGELQAALRASLDGRVYAIPRATRRARITARRFGERRVLTVDHVELPVVRAALEAFRDAGADDRDVVQRLLDQLG